MLSLANQSLSTTREVLRSHLKDTDTKQLSQAKGQPIRLSLPPYKITLGSTELLYQWLWLMVSNIKTSTSLVPCMYAHSICIPHHSYPVPSWTEYMLYRGFWMCTLHLRSVASPSSSLSVQAVSELQSWPCCAWNGSGCSSIWQVPEYWGWGCGSQLSVLLVESREPGLADKFLVHQ